jgi:hypothetical protein
MAIVINGSGTLSGLAVGGLPDGTVDDGTVASGITSSKLTGALPAISGASLTGVGISGVDTWVLSATFSGNADPLTANLRRDNTSANSLIGTGMALNTSTGLWTFPATGYWQVSAYVTYKATATDNRYCVLEMDYTANNGTSFTTPSLGRTSIANMSSTTYVSHNNTKIFDITDTSNQKVRFSIFKAVSSVETFGHGTENETYFTFIKLGDT